MVFRRKKEEIDTDYQSSSIFSAPPPPSNRNTRGGGAGILNTDSDRTIRCLQGEKIGMTGISFSTIVPARTFAIPSVRSRYTSIPKGVCV